MKSSRLYALCWSAKAFTQAFQWSTELHVDRDQPSGSHGQPPTNAPESLLWMPWRKCVSALSCPFQGSLVPAFTRFPVKEPTIIHNRWSTYNWIPELLRSWQIFRDRITKHLEILAGHVVVWTRKLSPAHSFEASKEVWTSRDGRISAGVSRLE